MLAARKPLSGAAVKRSLAVRSDSCAYAHRIIYAVCCLAGASSFVDDAHDNLVNEGVLGAIEGHNTPVLFDWMVRAFSFQGIADAVAADYMDRHGALTWSAIAADLDAGPACSKLQRADSSLKGNTISPHWKGWCDGRRLHTTDGCGAGEDRAWTT
jgi:hypothetical protein